MVLIVSWVSSDTDWESMNPGEGDAMADVEKLEESQADLRNVRALLPQVLRKLAYAADDDDSLQSFKDVSHGMHEWQAGSSSLESKYQELKPLIDGLINQNESQ